MIINLSSREGNNPLHHKIHSWYLNFRLSQTVDILEKKHSAAKETKMDNMKEQMKMKSLERQVEMKESEMMKLKQDNENLNKR